MNSNLFLNEKMIGIMPIKISTDNIASINPRLTKEKAEEESLNNKLMYDKIIEM